MKSLLAYIDRMKNAENMIFYCAEMAKDLNASVHFFHTFTPHSYPMGVPETASATVQLSRRKMREITNEVKKQFDVHINKVNATLEDPPVMNYQIEEGVAADLIAGKSKSANVDMVMVEGDTENDGFFISDRNMEIIRSSAIPVYVVPQELSYRPLREIIYATDYKEEDIETMKNLVGLAELYSAKITALHVESDLDLEQKVKNAGFRDMMTEKTGYKNIEVSTLADEKGQGLTETINKYASMIDADLIVLLKKNKGFLERIFTSSSTKKIIHKSHLPVMVYQEKEI